MQRLTKILLLLAMLAACFWSCDPEEEKISRDPSLELTLSADTVIFDTLLSSVGSITKRFKIFNPNKRAVALSRIAVGRGNDSEYSITINGVEGRNFDEEIIFGEDSMLVLVKVFIDPSDQDMPFLVKDSVIMEYNGNVADIKLVSWGQDANFIDGEIIACDAIWDSPKPYVIYSSALVDTLCRLTVMPGTTILIDNNASLFVKGALDILGTAEEKVVVRNTRLDPSYEIAPGQWNGIFFLEGSYDSHIEHAEIRNGQIGLRIGNPDTDDDFDVTVTNTSIGHMSIAGVLAFTSDVQMINCEIFNCQRQLFAGVLGGRYDVDHCTFSNSGSEFSRDEQSIVLSDNFLLDDGSTPVSELYVEFTNSIIWGDDFNVPEELLISLSQEVATEILLNNNIIKSTNTDWISLGNTISTDSNFPQFFSPTAFDFQIDSLSPARDAATDSEVLLDIIGTERDNLPDIGAYERKDSIP